MTLGKGVVGKNANDSKKGTNDAKIAKNWRAIKKNNENQRPLFTHCHSVQEFSASCFTILRALGKAL